MDLTCLLAPNLQIYPLVAPAAAFMLLSKSGLWRVFRSLNANCHSGLLFCCEFWIFNNSINDRHSGHQVSSWNDEYVLRTNVWQIYLQIYLSEILKHTFKQAREAEDVWNKPLLGPWPPSARFLSFPAVQLFSIESNWRETPAQWLLPAATGADLQPSER